MFTINGSPLMVHYLICSLKYVHHMVHHINSFMIFVKISVQHAEIPMRIENVIGDIELSGDGGEGSLYESWSHFAGF